MRPRKHHSDERQLRLNFQAVEHRFDACSKSANDKVFTGISRVDRGGRGTYNLQRLAETVQAEDRLRLLEPTSLPKNLRGWSPRPRPQTAIIARAAQRKYEQRVTQDEVIGKFLGQHAAKLRRLAKRLGA